MIAVGRRTSVTPGKVRFLRAAMLAGLLVLGWLMYAQAARLSPGERHHADHTLRYAGYGLCAFAIVALGVLRARRAGASGERRLRIALGASTVCEAAALMGAMYLGASGDASAFALAVVLFLASRALLPEGAP